MTPTISTFFQGSQNTYLSTLDQQEAPADIELSEGAETISPATDQQEAPADIEPSQGAETTSPETDQQETPADNNY